MNRSPLRNTGPRHSRIVAVVLGVSACGQAASEPPEVSDGAVAIAGAVFETSLPDPASVPHRSLGGADVVIGGWQQDSVGIPNVRAAAMLPDGTVWIATSMAGQILRFTVDGHPLRPLGGRGEGPGEFGRGPWGVHPCRNAVLVDEQWRYTFFAVDGSFQRVVVVPASVQRMSPVTVGVSPDCSTVLVRVGELPSARPGTVRGLDVLAWMDPTTGGLDTVAVVGGMERSGQEIQGRLEAMPTPFGSTGVWAQVGDSVYVGLSSDPVVTLFSRSGLPVRTLRWEATRRPVSRRETDAMEVDRAQQIDRDPRLVAYLPAIRDYPIPPTAPLFVSILASDDGDVWIREYPQVSDGFGLSLDGASAEPDRVLVFGRDGGLREIIAVPSEVRIHQVRGRRLLTSRIDEMGVPVVEIYDLP